MGYKTTLCDVSLDGGHYGIAAPAVDFKPGLPAYLRITDINDDGTLNPSDRKSVDDSSAGNYLLHEGDIVFARTGNSTGRNYYYDPRDGEYAYAGFLIKFSLDPRKINPRYMKYYAQSKQYWDWVSSFNTGSTRGNINAKTYASMPIDLLSRQIQDGIVAICDAIDDKIRINRQLNDYLLELISSVFAHRFSSNVNTTDLKNVLSISTKALKPQEHASEIWEHYSIPAFDEKHRPIFEPASEIKSNKYQIDNECILISKLNPSTKRIWMPYCSSNNAVCSTEFIVYRPYLKEYKSFYYAAIDSPGFTNYLLEHVSGSTGSRQRAQPKDTLHYLMPNPSNEEIKNFCTFADPIYRHVQINEQQTAKLELLRDTLLPKLMSGEIDVSKVDLTQLTNNHLAGRMHWSNVIRVRAIHAVHSQQSQIPAYESVPKVSHSPCRTALTLGGIAPLLSWLAVSQFTAQSFAMLVVFCQVVLCGVSSELS